MKDEIKLKDMTDFLENVYKDIKKQPTLEEELEKERKFINKIKGDNEDEIKEYIKEQIDKCYVIEHKDFEKVDLSKLLDYITNLQEIEKEHQKINGELRQEIDRLSNIINELEKIIKEDHEECKTIYDNFERSVTIYTKSLLDKLKELKENK